MFYSHDLLCRRKNGKFSIVWLAATSKKKINRPSCLKVNISQTCDEIATIIMTQHSSDGQGQPRVKFSLYLSSLLMHGTCMVYKQQVDIFLSDLIIVQQSLTQVQLSEEGFLVHAAVKERRHRDEDDDSEDEETGKSRPKKPRKPREAKVTVLRVVDMEEQPPLPVPVLAFPAPQPEGGQPLHLLNEADSRIHTVDMEFYQPLHGDQEGIMDIEALDKMGALFKQMNESMMAQKSNQEAVPVVEVVEEQPMEVEIPTEVAPPCQATELPKELQDAADIAPMETDALASTVAQADQNLAALVAPEEIIDPQLEETTALARETEPVAQPIPMVIDPVTEQEPQPVQPTTAQSPRKGKRNAVMPEQIPEKRKRCTRTFIDRTTTLDVEITKRQMQDPNFIRKTKRIQSYHEDIPDFHQSFARMHPEELLGIHAIEILNPALKNIFEYTLQITEKSPRVSNISVAVDRSRAGSEISKISFDRSRLSQNLSLQEKETSRNRTSITIPEEDLNISQIDIENVVLQQHELPRDIDLPPMMPDIDEVELLRISEVMPVLPTLQPDIAEEDLCREPEVVPTEQLDAVVAEANHVAPQQDYVELPIEEEFLFDEFLVPSTPVDKDLSTKKRERADASVDSTIDSSNSTPSTPRSQKEHNLILFLDDWWRHSDKIVTFRAICHPTKAVKKQAAKMFSILLEMKKYNKVELKQENPMGFGPIEILPPIFSSSCSTATPSSL